MIQNYLSIAFRQIKNNQSYFLINVVGLSIGIATSLLAILFVYDELSFDKSHTKHSRIFRLNKVVIDENGATSKRAESSGMMGPTLASEFPEIEAVVRYQPSYAETVIYQDNQSLFLQQGEIVFADNSLFEVFDYHIIEGNKETSLSRPSTILLTPDLAYALFGDASAVGKTVTAFDIDLEVTGIIAAAPRNGHQQFKALVSWSTTVPGEGPLSYSWMNNWIAQTISTYVLLKEGTDVSLVQEKLPAFMRKYMPSRMDMYKLYLQPFDEIYLNSSDVFGSLIAKVGSIQFLYLFSLIAFFILFLACVNYININTSKATKRAKEVGLRKTIGAAKNQLVMQFLGEALLVTSVAGALALLLVDLGIPVFNSLAEKSLVASQLLSPTILGGLVGLIIIVSALAGFYPAWVLSAFKPAEVLRPSSKSYSGGSRLRQVLIVIQFSISVTMIASAVVIQQQMNFMANRDLGFNKDRVIFFPLTEEIKKNIEPFVDAVRSHSSVEQMSVSRDVLGDGFASTMVIPEGMSSQLEVKMFRVSADFDKTFGLQMSDGRFFDYRQASDSNAIIVNEAFVRRAGWDNALQKTVKFEDNPTAFSILGVIKDFNYNSLKSEVAPLVMWIDPGLANIAVKYSFGDAGPLINFIEAQWKKYEQRYPFDFSFLDQSISAYYATEQGFQKTILLFSILSVAISCLGLYGLVSFTLEQKTKEIGIRKILGASVGRLMIVINQRFFVLLLLSLVVAVPVTLRAVSGWLNEFAYHVQIGVDAFLIAILITAIIIVASVGFQSLRAALVNPAESLRHE